jgi:hypothetical protein
VLHLLGSPRAFQGSTRRFGIKESELYALWEKYSLPLGTSPGIVRCKPVEAMRCALYKEMLRAGLRLPVPEYHCKSCTSALSRGCAIDAQCVADSPVLMHYVAQSSQ